MALPAGTVFEVRPGVGSDTNGGGFVTGSSGTDYSQQNSKNTVGSDISTTDGVGIGTTTFTSATANFSTAIPGNIIYINGGWYEVVSRTNPTTVILDRSPGTGTGWTLNIGGAMATVSNAAGIAVPSNTIYVKASGTYTVTTALVISLQSSSSPGNPFSIIGYTSTRGDNGQFTWTTATNSIDLVDFGVSSTSAINCLLQNISFTTTAGTKKDAIGSGTSSVNSALITLINCTINGFVVGIDGSNSTAYFEGLFVINSRVTACSSHGVRNGASTYMLGCMIDNNSGDGFNATTAAFPNTVAAWSFERSVFYKNGANGINFNGLTGTPSGTSGFFVTISHCDCSTNTSAGVVFGNALDPYGQISNSIFDANGTYGVAQSTSSSTLIASFLLYNNAFYNNGTAATLNIAAGIGTVTLSANPYTTIGSDFSLNSTAGGGAACKGAGWPGVAPFGTGHSDIGALQSSGSGGTTVNVIAPTQIRILQNEGE